MRAHLGGVLTRARSHARTASEEATLRQAGPGAGAEGWAAGAAGADALPLQEGADPDAPVSSNFDGRRAPRPACRAPRAIP